MSRLVLVGLVLLGLLAAFLAPADPPPTPERGFRLVSSAVLVCPRSTGAGGATNVLGAMVAGPTTGPGSAVLRPMQPGTDLVRLAAPGDPVALYAQGQSQPPTIMQADGSWAPTSLAGIAARQRSGATTGLSSAACTTSEPEWWFVGGGSQIGRSSALLVSNPSEEPARFDINLHSGAGPIPPLAGKGIDLGPGASVRLRLDALAPDEALLAVQVRATNGRVAAAMRDVAVPRADQARGVDYIPPAATPGTRLVLAGIPGGSGRRDLLLVNPGSEFATVTPSLLTETGPEPLTELPTIAVPAGAAIQVDLRRVLGGRAVSLDLSSDVPITGGARAEWGGATRDISWSAAVPPIVPPDPIGAAAAVPVLPGLETTVVLAAPDDEVRGTLTTTTVYSDDLATLSGESGADPATPQDAEVVLSTGSARVDVQRVTIPGGSQRTMAVSGGALDAGVTEAGLMTLVWRSDEGSGPAAAAHLALDPDAPLATGYPWWPVTSSVPAVGVRENLGVLAPSGRAP